MRNDFNNNNEHCKWWNKCPSMQAAGQKGVPPFCRGY